MRRILYTSLALLLALALTACASQPQADSGAGDQGDTAVSQPGEDAQAPSADAPEEHSAEEEETETVYTAAHMTGIDPYDPNLSVHDIDYSQQPAFTSTKLMGAYFQSCVDSRCRSIVFSCSRDVQLSLDEETFCNDYHVAWLVSTMQPGEYGKHCVLHVTYYPGDNVAWAYLNGDTSSLEKKELELYDAAVAWLEEHITEDMTDYEKCVAIHDYLSGNTQYDNELLAALNTSFFFDWGITAYGAMIDHNTICQGYADAFDMLTSMLGMNCFQIYGYGSGEAHNWNMIELDGQWYHVDCTFDDMFGVNDGTSAKAYLFSSDRQMALTHRWTAEDYPAAEDDGLWYYTREDLVVESAEDLAEKVDAVLLSGGQADVYVTGMSKKDVTDHVQDLGGQFHAAEYQGGVVLCAWIP